MSNGNRSLCTHNTNPDTVQKHGQKAYNYDEQILTSLEILSSFTMGCIIAGFFCCTQFVSSSEAFSTILAWLVATGSGFGSAAFSVIIFDLDRVVVVVVAPEVAVDGSGSAGGGGCCTVSCLAFEGCTVSGGCSVVVTGMVSAHKRAIFVFSKLYIT